MLLQPKPTSSSPPLQSPKAQPVVSPLKKRNVAPANGRFARGEAMPARLGPEAMLQTSFVGIDAPDFPGLARLLNAPVGTGHEDGHCTCGVRSQLFYTTGYWFHGYVAQSVRAQHS